MGWCACLSADRHGDARSAHTQPWSSISRPTYANCCIQLSEAWSLSRSGLCACVSCACFRASIRDVIWVACVAAVRSFAAHVLFFFGPTDCEALEWCLLALVFVRKLTSVNARVLGPNLAEPMLHPVHAAAWAKSLPNYRPCAQHPLSNPIKGKQYRGSTTAQHNTTSMLVSNLCQCSSPIL